MVPADLDAAVFRDRTLAEVPAVQGSTMLVPREDAPLALASARRFGAQHLTKLANACRVTDREIALLGDAVLRVLESGPRSAEELREALPKGTSRTSLLT